jgi:hypothetical protein
MTLGTDFFYNNRKDKNIKSKQLDKNIIILNLNLQYYEVNFEKKI